MMRIAIVSDIHGNLTAFEAVLADLRQTSPDLILHGGDLSDAGSSPVEIVDRIRDLGWSGVVGNTDEMLFDPQSLTDFASRLPKLESMFAVIGEMAAFTRQTLGEERVGWLRALPRVQIHGSMALVHASPESAWRSPMPEASDTEFQSVYTPLEKPVVVYGHIHRPFIRSVVGPGGPMTIANSGSVGLSHDGDRRASYLLLDDSVPSIHRVDYDLDQEIRALAGCGQPHSDWIVRTLQAATPQMP
jgi:predicted phosphodiesterase